jgi:hypothetical protein
MVHALAGAVARRPREPLAPGPMGRGRTGAQALCKHLFTAPHLVVAYAPALDRLACDRGSVAYRPVRRRTGGGRTAVNRTRSRRSIRHHSRSRARAHTPLYAAECARGWPRVRGVGRRPTATVHRPTDRPTGPYNRAGRRAARAHRGSPRASASREASARRNAAVAGRSARADPAAARGARGCS